MFSFKRTLSHLARKTLNNVLVHRLFRRLILTDYVEAVFLLENEETNDSRFALARLIFAKFVFFFCANGCFRSGASRPISAPPGSADGESPRLRLLDVSRSPNLKYRACLCGVPLPDS